MEQKRRQLIIRQQFGFRVGVLAFSVIGLVLYGACQKNNSTFLGAVLGLSGSALVWAFVELVDFYIQTFHQYVHERNQFIRMVDQYWREIRTHFKNQSNHDMIFWMKVEEKINELYEKVALYPLSGGIFSISEEYERAVGYIARIYWKFSGYKYGSGNKEDQQYWEPLNGIFISREELLDPDAKSSIEKLIQIPQKYDELKSLKVDFEYYKSPEDLIISITKGDLKESYSIIPVGHVEYFSFKPLMDFREKFQEQPGNGTLVTVSKLILRKINT